ARTLQGQQTRARFIFHNRFSASSFFLPSHFLRANRIFDMPESTETLTAIRGERIAENSSSRLVEMVASGQADLAAVWDATKNKFEKPGQAAGAQVYFSQLPQLIPNDLLVCSTSLSATTKEALRAAIRGLGPGGIGIGDFKTWQDIRDASDARAALADLRWLARERAAPVTIDIRLRSGANRPQHALMIEAARQAVRLAGTELVLYDPDFHEHIDFVWTIEPVHDGAVVLRSAIPGASVDDQIFRLSFRDSEDLAKRVVGLIHTRLHRIRYIWPYSTSQPILIRDLPFALPAGTSVKAQRISWLDPERNKFRAGPLFNARISHSGYYRYAFDTDDFARAGEAITNLDPLGNTSYRVFLLRPGDERLVFVILTGVVIALLLIAAGAFIHDWIKTRAAQETTEEVETLPTLEV
ncbi:MAG: PhnD/SsuA/transferrin family substrate-binding protein, partial [Vicinamibacteria bacterium]|nr:PhnD/SsuA/transferrin family substrate-binding protein [Vicinamibacteria bacterium]